MKDYVGDGGYYYNKKGMVRGWLSIGDVCGRWLERQMLHHTPTHTHTQHICLCVLVVFPHIGGRKPSGQDFVYDYREMLKLVGCKSKKVHKDHRSSAL